VKQLKGLAASPGIALGPAFVYRPVELAAQRLGADDPAAEWARFQLAAAAALEQLALLRQKAVAEVGEAEAAIFDAHQMIIGDPDTETELRTEIDGGASAAAAVDIVFSREVKNFETMDNPLFRERAADFADVRRRLLRALLGVSEDSLAVLDRPVVVVAHDLMPSDTAQMNKAMVRGFCTAAGGPLSHTAILARNLGLPAVVGAGEGVMAIENEAPIIVDGAGGLIVIGANDEERADYERRAQALAEARATVAVAAHEAAITRDGRRVEVVANIGLPGEETDALQAGAEGIGLLRTEFLFVDRQTAPTEDEQFRAYRPIFEAMGQRPVIARTLDIGGDKPLAFLSVPHEANPFLGWRAIRIGLAQPELLKTQLRALLRAGRGCNLKIMFPMVATVEEMRAARALVEESRAELKLSGEPLAESVEIGMMVEIPSAALMIDLLAPYADFFSIGSNDLTQYTLAADRGNPAVASLVDSLHPAVLRLVDNVIRAAHAAQRRVGMCGEMAGDLNAIPILLGLGLDEFSMGAAAVPPAKALLRQLSLAAATALARKALAQPTAAAVRETVKRWLADERQHSP